MATKSEQAAIDVIISSDRQEAEILIPAEFPREMLSVHVCLAALRDEGVETGAEVSQSIEKLLEENRDTSKPIRGVVARAAPPVPGVDGYIEWVVDQQQEPAEEQKDESDTPAPQVKHRVCYYSKSAFTMVKQGQVIAIVHQPEPGQDGRDVTGKTITCRSAKAVDCKFDESFREMGQGKVAAAIDGVLYRRDGKAEIRNVIEVTDNVDFSTGNIDFDGDVIVHRAVKDNFIIRSGSNIEVRGLVEDATLEAKGNITTSGGFAGRERGHAKAGQDFNSRYLDNVESKVEGVLRVDREVINCETTVRGSVDSPHAAIIGGILQVTGQCHVSTLGSNAGVATTVILGAVPWLEGPYLELIDLTEKLEGHVKYLQEDLDRIMKMSATRRLAPVDAERQTEISFQLEPARQQLKKASETRQALEKRIEQYRIVALIVERCLHQNVRLVLDGQSYRIRDDMKGPLKIERTNGQLVYRIGEAKPESLASIADVGMYRACK